jgi:hypothetical protein
MLKGVAFNIEELQPFKVEGCCLHYERASTLRMLKGVAFNLKGLQPFNVEGFCLK